MNTTHRTLSATVFVLFTACDEPAAPETAGQISLRDESTDPCERLTPAALQAVVDELDDAVALAEANAEAITSDAYPAATDLAVDDLDQARDYLVAHQAWLTANNLDIASSIAAYNLHCAAREAALQASHGYYWAAISAIYNHTAEGELAARRGMVAHQQLAALGADGLGCYMQAYLGG